MQVAARARKLWVGTLARGHVRSRCQCWPNPTPRVTQVVRELSVGGQLFENSLA